MPRQERQQSATGIYHVMLKGINKQDIFEEGYCQAGRYSDTEDSFTFYYYDRDHLGNIRQVTKVDKKKDGTVVQTMKYYPFGTEFCDGTANGSVQPYKYNGKEFDGMHGLNTYDYGARQYNPVTAHWDRVDPLCEKYYSMSPYNYCGGDPENAIDPNGKEKIDALSPDEENNNLKAGAHNFKDEKSVINIWAHGSSDGMTIYDKEKNKNIRITTVKEFLSFFDNNSTVWKTHKKGEPVVIVLHSCKTGKRENGRDSFAQILSKGISDAVIIAPSDNLYVSNGQEIGTFNSKIERKNTNINSLAGTWYQFEKGTCTRQYAGNTLPGESGYKIVTNNSSLWEKFVYNISMLF